MSKSVVTISRNWNNPKITTTITGEHISIQMSIEDFVTALKAEIGSVTWVMTKAGFEARLDAAVATVLQGMKDETVKVV